MRVAFVTPPPAKPSEPALSAPAAALVLGRYGVKASAIDASIGWHRYALASERLQQLLAPSLGFATPAFARAVRALAKRPQALRCASTYADRRLYSSAVNHLEMALRLVARPFADLRLGVAQLGSREPGARPESSAWLGAFAARVGPFDEYFTRELIPALAAGEATHVGVSLTFQQQAPAAMRLAVLLREQLPSVVRLLGGPLVACWRAAGVGLGAPPFDLFDRVLDGDERDLAALAEELDGAPVRGSPAPGPLFPAFDDTPWDEYLAPMPIVPAALGRGCYWRRCTFCPDSRHAAHAPCAPEALPGWLREVAARFPQGAMVHFTDSALPPRHLEIVANCIAGERLPLGWHGFARLEPEFANPAFAVHLARGGCRMLQFGVESGSERLLELMGKGHDSLLAARVLRSTAAAGIRNQVYLLFGLPSEAEEDREATLALVERAADAIHAINPALLNLPRGSPMHRHPERFGITELVAFNDATDLSLYDDFRCGRVHPRLEARRWLSRRFLRSAPVRGIGRELRSPLKANHLCFL
jgi:hypothetical protein